jgi:ubiquinone/menaquinone biosynthesis C-methylase UbiE
MKAFRWVLASLCIAASVATSALAQPAVSTRVVDPAAHAVPAASGYPYRQHVATILAQLDLRPGDVAVDLGTGDGWWAEKFAGAVGPQGTVYAGELKEDLVERLKQKFAATPQLKPYVCKPDSPELPDDSCDLAFLSQVYHHLPADGHVAYLEKLRRVVKPDGRLCIIEKYTEIAVHGRDHGTQLSKLAAECEQAGWIALRYELIPATAHYMAVFAQREIFAPAPSANGKPKPAEARPTQPPRQPEPLRVGAAEVDITPPVGYRMSGYFYERPSTGTHNPLKAKALAIAEGDTRAAIVCCDVIGIPWAVTERARRLVEQKTGIPAQHLVLSATHTHTGPLYHGVLRQHFHQKAVADEGVDPREPLDYAERLAEKIAEAVDAAQKAQQPASVASGIAQREGLAFNRRFHMKDGTVRFNPGKMNPEIVKPAGPTDPDVGLVLFRSADGSALAGLTVFALHLDTVGGTEYGGDYPFYLAESLRASLGERFVSVFGTGTCGDINHVDVSHREPQKGQGEAERIGRALAETIVQQVPKLKASQPRLAVRHAMVEVPLQQPSDEELAWAEENVAKVGQRALPFLEEVKLCTTLDLKRRGSKTIALPVQTVRLADDVAIVALPGEVFVDLGLAIKRASPFATTLVIELANDCPAYVPTRKAFAEGSYETVNSRVAPGGGEALVDAAIAQLKDLAARPLAEK